jgi:predicted phosphodiesterase
VRVAFLSDVHANLPALCRALESARRNSAEALFCAGDLVGGGPHPTEVVRLLMECEIPCILGNVDRKVLSLGRDAKPLRRRIREGRGAAVAWTALSLGEEERAWLASLSTELRLTLGGTDAWIVHGSPLSDEDYLFPSLTARALGPRLKGERPGLLVCGHTHIPFARAVGAVRVVNCGSVGRPIDGDPRGSYALCDFGEGGRVRSRIVRFTYPVEALVADLESRGVPKGHPALYRTGSRRAF